MVISFRRASERASESAPLLPLPSRLAALAAPLTRPLARPPAHPAELPAGAPRPWRMRSPTPRRGACDTSPRASTRGSRSPATRVRQLLCASYGSLTAQLLEPHGKSFLGLRCGWYAVRWAVLCCLGSVAGAPCMTQRLLSCPSPPPRPRLLRRLARRRLQPARDAAPAGDRRRHRRPHALLGHRCDCIDCWRPRSVGRLTLRLLSTLLSLLLTLPHAPMQATRWAVRVASCFASPCLLALLLVARALACYACLLTLCHCLHTELLSMQARWRCSPAPTFDGSIPGAR